VATVLVFCIFGAACGDFQDDVRPTPTRAPTSTPDPNATHTPTPSCVGPGGVPGCRDFTWSQNMGNDNSGSAVFASTDFVGDVGNAGLNFDVMTFPSFRFDARQSDDVGVYDVKMVGLKAGETADGQPLVYFFVKLLSDGLCLRFFSGTSEGRLYCDGRIGQGVDTMLTAPTGDFPRDEPRDQVLTSDLGESAPAGSLSLRVSYQLMRTSEGTETSRPGACLEGPLCGPGDVKDCYQPVEETILTTGTAFVEKGDVALRQRSAGGQPPPPPGISGEPFDCATWQVSGGPGRLVTGLVDYDTLVKDTASGIRWSDQ